MYFDLITKISYSGHKASRKRRKLAQEESKVTAPLLPPMKVGVLICGQLRSWRMCGPILRRLLLDRYDADVFLCVDLNNSVQSEHKNPSVASPWSEFQAAVDLYRPVRIWWGHQFAWLPWTRPTPYLIAHQPGQIHCHLSPTREYCVQGTHYDRTTPKIALLADTRRIYEPVFRQYYFVQHGLTMIRDYAEETGIKYDMVFRTRFDQLFFHPDLDAALYSHLPRNPHNKKLIYTPNPVLPTTILPPLPLDRPGSDSEIYVFGAGNNSGMFYINDQYWICSYKQATEVMIRFGGAELERLFRLFEDEECWFGREAWTEIVFGRFLVENNIRIYKSEIPDGDFIRLSPAV